MLSQKAENITEKMVSVSVSDKSDTAPLTGVGDGDDFGVGDGFGVGDFGVGDLGFVVGAGVDVGAGVGAGVGFGVGAGIIDEHVNSPPHIEA